MGGETSEPSSNISEQPDRQHRECREPSKAHHQRIAARQGKESRVCTDDSNSQTPDHPSRATEERLRAEEKPSVQVDSQNKQPYRGQHEEVHFADPSRNLSEMCRSAADPTPEPTTPACAACCSTVLSSVGRAFSARSRWAVRAPGLLPIRSRRSTWRKAVLWLLRDSIACFMPALAALPAPTSARTPNAVTLSPFAEVEATLIAASAINPPIWPSLPARPTPAAPAAAETTTLLPSNRSLAPASPWWCSGARLASVRRAAIQAPSARAGPVLPA